MDRNGVAVKRFLTNALGEIPLLNGGVFVVIVIDASSADVRYEEDFFPPRRRREESIILCVCVRACVWSLVFSLTTARAVIVLLNNYKNLPKVQTSLLLCLFRYHPPHSHYHFDVHSLKLPR